jgi:serine acetyltransferase
MVRARFRFRAYVDALRAIFRWNSILHFWARVLPGGFSLRPFLHRLRGVKIGENVWIGDDVYLDEDHPDAIEIQEGAAIATRCTIIAFTKGTGRIIIEKWAAIGAGSTIICASGKTLKIGEGSVISAGSTVQNDIPAHTLCGPPRIQIYGKVEVPYRAAETLEEFRRGLRPLGKPKERLASIPK